MLKKIKRIEIMKELAELIGMTEVELKEFYLLYVNKSISMGFSEDEARSIVQEAFRKQLGLI